MTKTVMIATKRLVQLTMPAAVLLTGVMAGPVLAGSTTPAVKLEYQTLTCVRGSYHHGLVVGQGKHVIASSARDQAKRDWRANTTRRYGAAYANLNKARDRRTACKQFGFAFSCSVIARPCKNRTFSNTIR